MLPENQVQFRALLFNVIEKVPTLSPSELLEAVADIELWVDQLVDVSVTHAYRKLAKIDSKIKNN